MLGKIVFYTKCFFLEYIVNSVLPHCPIWRLRKITLRLFRTKIGKGSFIMRKNYIMNTNKLTIGNYSHINRGCLIDARGNITIGNSKYLASKNMVTFEEHYNYNFDSKKLVYKLSIIYEDNLGGFGFEREIEL